MKLLLLLLSFLAIAQVPLPIGGGVAICSPTAILNCVQPAGAVTFQTAYPVPAVTGTSYPVSNWGAVGDGVTDDTAHLQNAINAAPANSILAFGNSNKTYLISAPLVLQPNVSYSGRATILMSASATAHNPILEALYNASNNISIGGLTLDANGVGGCIQLAVNGAGAIPANNVQIVGATCRNTTMSPAGAWDGVIYDPVGLTNSIVSGNFVYNCGLGIYIVNPNMLTVSDNGFNTVSHSDAIELLYSNAPFLYGQGIQILRNHGQHLGRMAIEIWADTTVTNVSNVVGAQVVNNSFSSWDQGFDPQPFGISVMAGSACTIVGNSMYNGYLGTGLELGCPNSTVTGNTFNGFPVGISLLNSAGSSITNNLLLQPSSIGIEITNVTVSALGSRANLTISGNRIVDAQQFGIYSIDGSTWSGSTISNNSIWRNAGVWAGDATQAYVGIAITPPAAAYSVTGNEVYQTNASPTSGFNFVGIRVNGGASASAGATYANNTVLSYGALTTSYGIYGNSPGSLDYTNVTNNYFQGLGSASTGSSSSHMIGLGNLSFNCTAAGPLVLNQ